MVILLSTSYIVTQDLTPGRIQMIPEIIMFLLRINKVGLCTIRHMISLVAPVVVVVVFLTCRCNHLA